MSDLYSAIVIGAGINGLSTCYHLVRLARAEEWPRLERESGA